MGLLFQASCERCGYCEDFFVGSGMDSRLHGGALDEVPEEYREQVKAILRDYPDCQGTWAYDLCRCPSCDLRFQAFWFRIVYADGKVLEPEHKCPSCRTAALPLDDVESEGPGDMADWPCPKCGRRGLTEGGYGVWD